jgi:hypothetical protein
MLCVTLPCLSLLAAWDPRLVASFADRVPGLFFGLPLLALASLIFAATHHEDPAAIGLATVHWTVWLGGILGLVLAVVLLLGWIN